MNSKRRGLLAFLGGAVLGGSASAASSKPLSFAVPRVAITPRHVLCFLGGKDGLPDLGQAARSAIGQFADGFSVDESYSVNEPDDRMEQSFAVCWDRVKENAFDEMDEQAVAGHGSVLYVLGPPMKAETTVATSATALRLVEAMLDHGAVAVKGESAGVAHGRRRWKELAGEARSAVASGDLLGLATSCRLAFARRPIGDPTDNEDMASVGFHLVGLPDVVIDEVQLENPKVYTNGNQLEIARFMDELAAEMAADGISTTVASNKYLLSDDNRYEEDSYKFNPFGIVSIKRKRI